jgi:hypothetical protein
MNKKSQETQEQRYAEERKSIRNHERDVRTAEMHRETEAKDKSNKHFQAPSPAPQEGKEKLKM